MSAGERANAAGHQDEDSDQSDDSEPVETLVQGRDRRSTAGNLMQSMIQQEEDDDLTLLFADGDEEEDVEFQESDVAASDAELDSSSDDDDQGPNAAAEDLDGEVELQKESKLQKSRKRKAQDAFTTVAGLRKRIKANAQATAVSNEPRPKKKLERVSWLPNLQDGPTRASARKQTVQNKKVTHARLKDHEVRRAKVAAQMEKAGRTREQHQPKQMTQADRLAEALKTEKQNSKSLNRWEETERKRAEEQAAKLAALKDRKLEGPVVSWWSGMATWLGTKLIKFGSKDTDQEMWAEPRKRGRRPKHLIENADSLKGDGGSSVGTPRDQTATPGPPEPPLAPRPPAEASDQGQAQPKLSEPSQPESTIKFTAPQGPDTFLLQGIQEYAAMPNESASLVPSKPPSLGNGAPGLSGPPAVNSPPVLNLPSNPLAPTPFPTQAPVPPQISHSTRNIVVLSNFDNLPLADRGEFSIFYNLKKPGKTNKAPKVQQELCPITSLPARYRDPASGVAYANAQAYKRLKDLQKNKFTWSSMLGCYVGESGVVARGVPEGFAAAPVE